MAFPSTRHSALDAIRSGDERERRRALDGVAENHLRLEWNQPHEAAAGVFIGLFARKVGRTAPTAISGLVIGALLAFGVASMQGAHYLAIILPGSLVGLLTGFATVRYGRPPAPAV